MQDKDNCRASIHMLAVCCMAIKLAQQFKHLSSYVLSLADRARRYQKIDDGMVLISNITEYLNITVL